MDYTTIDDPTAFFQAKLYTGTGSSNAVTYGGNSDMQPDWLLFKNRQTSLNWMMWDSVRGITKYFYSNLNEAEGTTSTVLTAIGSDGFTVGNNDNVNKANENIGHWGWKAGTAFSNDASSTSVGSIDSTGSVSTDSGFSIISYTGTGSNGTIAHGLGSVPQVVLLKERDGTNNWLMYHETLNASLGDYSRFMTFNSNGAVAGANNVVFQNSVFTSSVFNVGTSAGSNGDGTPYIAYCFAEKQGYSKFGTYAGNDVADGPFIYTGFKPAFFLTKRSNAGEQWMVYDNKQLGFNESNNFLGHDTANGESTGAGSNGAIDILSNGIKIRGTVNGTNNSGSTYIYMAFAESPFVTSTGVPATAR